MHYQKQKIRKWKQATMKTRAANLRKIQRRIDENRRILNEHSEGKGKGEWRLSSLERSRVIGIISQNPFNVDALTPIQIYYRCLIPDRKQRDKLSDR